MFTLEELLCYKSLSPLRITVGVIRAHLCDIRLAMEQKEEVALTNIFPFLDFQFHRQSVSFTPQKYTTLSLDLVSFVAYHGMTDIVAGLLPHYDTGSVRDILTIPLCLSLLNNKSETARFLLSKGADPRGEACTNGLHAAAKAGLQNMVSDFIVQWKIPADCVDAYGATPTIYALYLPENHAIKIITVLLYHGASPKRTFGSNCTTYACLANAMGKKTLAHWLQQTETDSFNYAIDCLQKQTQNIRLEEENDADWDFL
ncbi:unnamed protein product [Fusarium langsethiae]|nr:unnamed protein product [Fusarium langsethiae]